MIVIHRSLLYPGHAVLLAERWVGQEPFLLLLGDHLFRSGESRSVARQVVEAFQTFGDSQSVVGIYEEALSRVKHYGTVAGEWVAEQTLQLSRLHEKPTEDEARTYLTVGRHGREGFYCVNGIYACEHPYLLADTLRGRWGFEGLVMSDWGATHNVVPAVRAGLVAQAAPSRR